MIFLQFFTWFQLPVFSSEFFPQTVAKHVGSGQKLTFLKGVQMFSLIFSYFIFYSVSSLIVQ